MTEYHPPMTGLESHFEDELAAEGHMKGQELPDAMQQQMRTDREAQQHAKEARDHETQADHITEEAMQSGM